LAPYVGSRVARVRGKPFGCVPFRGRVAVALPHPITRSRERGAGSRYPPVSKQAPGPRERVAWYANDWRPTVVPRGTPTDARRPAERGDGRARAPRPSPPVPSGRTIASWGRGDLGGEAPPREQNVPPLRGMRSPPGNPATGAERPRATPRRRAPRAASSPLARAARRAPRVPGTRRPRRGWRASGCGNCASTAAPGRRSGVHGGREAVGRAGAAQGDEDRAGGRVREQEFERAYFVASVGRGGAVFPLDAELGDADGAASAAARSRGVASRPGYKAPASRVSFESAAAGSRT